MKNFKEIVSKYTVTDKIKFADFYSTHIGNLCPKKLLEIGVLTGESLRVWKEFFPTTAIFGIDIDPNSLEGNQDLDIFIGDQVDKDFLNKVITETGIPDIVIDDGGHCRSQQIITFSHLFPKLNSGGIYVIEDIETCFLEQYNDSKISTIQMLTNLVYPTNFDGNTEGLELGIVFNYIYSSIIFSKDICMVVKK